MRGRQLLRPPHPLDCGQNQPIRGPQHRASRWLWAVEGWQVCFKGKQARSSSICMLCPVKFGVDRFVDIAGEACAFESFEQRLETRQFCAMEIKCSDVIRCLLPGVPCSLVGHTNQQTCKTNTIKEENVELRSPPILHEGATGPYENHYISILRV